ncbi:MAG: LysR family transcriptional regulator [Devosia nanyangense]|uniref:LysR family transcriptional regulator n=1 Tax=Devosia nanyangense TaxID=1228055 RepID=A0A933L3S4_9HYPH|nr:LysR family transcriptional regulator [Devosia nanyangense]
MTTHEPDWALWRSFSAVVANGSLSAAARRIGYSQPTLGRHIETLEQQLGVALFDRTLQGLRPTETALRLYQSVSAAEAKLSEATLIAEGSTGDLEGTVRITASTVVSHYILPAILRSIREQFPAIALELVPSDSVENLLLRESDIAVRMFRPTQLELIAKKLGELPIVCTAHASYLGARGTPATPAELIGHSLIGLDRSDLIITEAKKIGIDLKRSDFALRTDSQTGGWELLKAGLGIGFAQASLVGDTPGMRALLPMLKIPPLDVWLTTHRELFLSPRIRAIYDRLAVGLSGYIARTSHRAPSTDQP